MAAIPESRMPGIKALVGLNIMIYVVFKLLWVLLPDAHIRLEELLQWIALPGDVSTLVTRPWTILTYAFVQVDFIHLLVNMLWLWWFGSLLGELRGKTVNFAVYLGGAATGALSYLLFNHITQNGEAASLTGASAATAAIIVTTAILAPKLKARLIFFGGAPMVIVAAVALICYLSSSGETVAAHCGGIVAGVFAGVLLRWRASHHRKEIKKIMAADSRRNMLLGKVRTSGFGSLTEEERKSLFDMTAHSKNINSPVNIHPNGK